MICRSRPSSTLEGVLNAPADPPTAPGEQRAYRGVITDWGGVMTNPIPETVRAWLDAEDIDYTAYATVMRPWVLAAYDPGADGNPIHALERGECMPEEFERLLASRLTRRDGREVPAEGLLARMFAGSVPSGPMHQAIRAVRGSGLLTGVLSNSWGSGFYPRYLSDMFDAVVISAEVGMRKPEERIFLHAAELLGLAPEECVFIDDIEANVVAAEAVGMTGVLHADPTVTVARLGELLALPLP